MLYGALLLAERMTTQELARVSQPATHETAALMWKPRLLRGDGFCEVALLDSRGKVVDTARLGLFDAAFNVLQQCGQLGFEGRNITVANLHTGELVRRFVVRDGRLSPPE